MLRPESATGNESEPVSFFCFFQSFLLWLRHCATNRKVSGSITDGVIGIFHCLQHSGRTVALRSSHPLIEMLEILIASNSWKLKGLSKLVLGQLCTQFIGI